MCLCGVISHNMSDSDTSKYLVAERHFMQSPLGGLSQSMVSGHDVPLVGHTSEDDRSVESSVNATTPVYVFIAPTKQMSRSVKRKRKKVQSYKIYIHKVLHQLHPGMSITVKSMSIIDSFMNDMLHRIASEAQRLGKRVGRGTLNTRDISTAIRLVLPQILSGYALGVCTEAYAQYKTSE
jgi:histone H2B